MEAFERGQFDQVGGRLEEIWEQDRTDPKVAEYLAMGYLYGEHNVDRARPVMKEAIARGGQATFQIQHSHEKMAFLQGDPMNNYCSGKLSISPGTMAFISELTNHSVKIDAAEPRNSARKNLEEAVAIRDNDPAAQYFYGKVLETIGRTPEDRKLSEQSFIKAAQFDKQQENFGAHLHRALMMIADDNSGNSSNSNQLKSELDTYVTDYVRYQIEYSKSLLLPPNIDTIADYMGLYGASDWQPKMPEGAATVRVSEAVLPSSPDQSISPKTVSSPGSSSRVQCPPGMQVSAAALSGTRAGMAANLGCVAIQKLPHKK